MLTGRERPVTGSFMKPTDRSFLEEAEEDMEEDREDFLGVYW